jgi:Zn-dependent protease
VAAHDIAVGLIWYVVLLFSLTFHEAGHAWAAARGGDLTAYLGGQVSLDPRPHVRREPFGTVFMPILSFAMMGWMIGWASTPYDPRWAYAHPRRAGWMALAGPAANLVLVIAAGFGIRVGMFLGLVEPAQLGTFTELVSGAGAPLGDALALFLSLLFMLNLLLLVFNLIPMPPLDGSGVVALFLPEDTSRRLQQFFARPLFAFGGILVAWLTIPRVFWPVAQFATAALFPEYL